MGRPSPGPGGWRAPLGSRLLTRFAWPASCVRAGGRIRHTHCRGVGAVIACAPVKSSLLMIPAVAGWGGARQTRRKNRDERRAQPIMSACITDGLRAACARVLAYTGTHSTHPTEHVRHPCDARQRQVPEAARAADKGRPRKIFHPTHTWARTLRKPPCPATVKIQPAKPVAADRRDGRLKNQQPKKEKGPPEKQPLPKPKTKNQTRASSDSLELRQQRPQLRPQRRL